MADGRMNRSALALGVFFVLAGVAFLLDQLDVWNVRIRYLLPSLLIALGVAILVGGRTGGRTRGEESGAAGTDEPDSSGPS